MTRNFRSDNESPVAPEIMDALGRANDGFVYSYGEDASAEALDRCFSEVFETDVVVWPLISGTAANSLALAQICPPFGAVYCHAHAHINTDECGAPGFYTAGAVLQALNGNHGKLSPDVLAAALAGTGQLGDHEVLPSALSITQATEFGTVYTSDEIAALCEIGKKYRLRNHLDGARFANAVASTGASPAALTWKSGIDLMSFGVTKNGAMMAESLIVFDPVLCEHLGRRRKRAGHLLSKMRYVTAQLMACIDDDRWLRWAGNANRQATRLADGLTKAGVCEILHPVEANEVFVRLDPAQDAHLRGAGFEYHQWPGTTDVFRFVCCWCTSDEEIDALLNQARNQESA